ncbi:hypothetical protein RB195_017377 [Necator americanus]|uniref:Uncharacterized protein n=1 Tax=Necator americanus TaxID=51031 RepID=A0ABR1C8J8_NECAM
MHSGDLSSGSVSQAGKEFDKPTFRLLGIGSLVESKPHLRFTTVSAKCRKAAPDPNRRKEVYNDCVIEDSLSQGDWHIKEDPKVDYKMLLGGLRACSERASNPLTANLDSIPRTTKELLKRRRTLRLDPNASHIERQKKILEAAQRRTSLKKCRRDLREYNIPLAALLSKYGIRMSSRR